MLVMIKKLNDNAKVPTYANIGDAGLDLTAVTKEFVYGDRGEVLVKYGTGLAFEIPESYVGLVFPRSSIYKKGLSLTNSVGVVDSGYRGEIMFYFRLEHEGQYEVGDRIGQIVILPYPKIEIVQVPELPPGSRGTNGFGSTGN